ncbi:DUF1987 domain-containing protein [Pantoea sp. JGM49]|uniref:DUF1987 domain-containing protein n=1 Tax=unclassified Pantoea TaxID=2630326 RepID=UPI001329D995|nr:MULTISPECIES: DUF1987 domain-containing protein [unclassified Pantoea]MBS0881219.1 DUF1987 domain-containing protein [Pantoea sp. JGM49]MXP53985.1 DUF1987 domain-containing protein [Pantoea sp. Seng]
MQNLVIAATESTPEVNFDFESGQFSLRGESWPENAAAFYRPLLDALESWQPAQSGQIEASIALRYFNSSSTKMLFSLFDLFNQLAQKGQKVELNWFFDEEDDVSEEFGQELALDFTDLQVNLRAEMAS